jgi:hypothetical protein
MLDDLKKISVIYFNKDAVLIKPNSYLKQTIKQSDILINK